MDARVRGRGREVGGYLVWDLAVRNPDTESGCNRQGGFHRTGGFHMEVLHKFYDCMTKSETQVQSKFERTLIRQHTFCHLIWLVNVRTLSVLGSRSRILGSHPGLPGSRPIILGWRNRPEGKWMLVFQINVSNANGTGLSLRQASKSA